MPALLHGTALLPLLGRETAMSDIKIPAGMRFYALPGFEKTIQAAADEEVRQLRRTTDEELAALLASPWFLALPGLSPERPHSAAERTRSPRWRAGTRRTKRQARRRG